MLRISSPGAKALRALPRPALVASADIDFGAGHLPLVLAVALPGQQLGVGIVQRGDQSARRSAQGIDPGRLALLIAVLEQRVGLSLAGLDVYVSVVGGVRVTEPGSDLAGSRCAIASALPATRCRAISSLSVRSASPASCARSRRRPAASAEARRLGFDQLVVPRVRARRRWRHVRSARATLADALDLVGLGLGAESVGGAMVSAFVTEYDRAVVPRRSPDLVQALRLSRRARRCAKASTASSRRRWAR